MGNALQFDPRTGSSNLGVADNDSLDFGTSTDFTLEGWIKAADTSVQRFIEKRLNGNAGGYNFHFNNTSNGWRVIVEPSPGSTRCTIDTDRVKAIDDQWHYVVAVVYRRNSCTVNDSLIYIDGKRETTAVQTSSSNNNANIDISSSLNIGRNNAGSGGLRGAVDEVRISRTARDPAWIKASYETVMGDFQTYGSEETLGSELISSIFDAEKGMSWGYLAYEAEEPEKTAARVKVRTGNNMYLSDAPDFEVCDSIVNKSDISKNNCVTDGHRYIQYQIILDTTEAGKTPIFKEISITDFLAHPVVKGISTVASPSPLPSVIYDLESPQAGPMPSPSPIQNSGFLQPIWDFFEALVH